MDKPAADMDETEAGEGANAPIPIRRAVNCLSSAISKLVAMFAAIAFSRGSL